MSNEFMQVPIGMMVELNIFSPVPDGYLPCIGDCYKITNYKELYEAIGDTYKDEYTQEGYFRLPRSYYIDRSGHYRVYYIRAKN